MFEALSPDMPVGMKAVFANLWLSKVLWRKRLASAPRTNALVRTTVAPTIFQAGVKEKCSGHESPGGCQLPVVARRYHR